MRREPFRRYRQVWRDEKLTDTKLGTAARRFAPLWTLVLAALIAGALYLVGGALLRTAVMFFVLWVGMMLAFYLPIPGGRAKRPPKR